MKTNKTIRNIIIFSLIFLLSSFLKAEEAKYYVFFPTNIPFAPEVDPTVRCLGMANGETFKKNGLIYEVATAENAVSLGSRACTSNITDMTKMFYQDTVFPDVSNWDTSSVRVMDRTFGALRGSEVPDVSRWDTSKVEYMTNTFSQSYIFPDFSGWNTSSLIDMSGLFFGVSGNIPDLSKWNTSNVVSMRGSFQSSNAFFNISNWDTSSVNNMSDIFTRARNIPDISKFNTSNVTNLRQAFAYSSTFNQDLSKWCVSKVTNSYNFDYASIKWEEKNKPKFGTCPQ